MEKASKGLLIRLLEPSVTTTVSASGRLKASKEDSRSTFGVIRKTVVGLKEEPEESPVLFSDNSTKSLLLR